MKRSGLDPQEAAAGLEQVVGARHRRCRERQNARRRRAGIRKLSRAGKGQLEGRSAAPRCCPTPATPPSSGGCSITWRRRQNASVALLRVNGEAIAAQVLMYCGNDGLHVENGVRRDLRQVFAGHAADRQDHRRAVRRAGYRGDQFLRRRSKLHGPVVGRAPNHGRYAGAISARENRSATEWKPAGSSVISACASLRDRLRHRHLTPAPKKLGMASPP